MTQVVIDLGEIPPEQSQPEPVRARRRRRYPRVWILLAVLVAGLAVGGATRLAAPLATASTVDFHTGQVFQLAGDRLYAVDKPDLLPARLTGYGLPSGRALWTTPLPVPAKRLVLAQPAGVLLAAGPDATGSVAAVDLATGRVRWRDPGRLVDLAPDGRRAVVLTVGSAAVAVVDLATGIRMWSWTADLPLDSATILSAVNPAGEWLVAVRAPDGRTRVLYPATMEVVVGMLPAPREDSPTNPGPAVLAAAGGLLTLRYRSLDWGVVDAYDLATLRPRWHQIFASIAPYLDDCGTLVCVGGERDGLFALDPADGRVVWADGRRNGAIRLTAGPPGRLLAFQAALVSELGSRQLAVLDAATGRSLVELGDGWWPEPGALGEKLLLALPSRTGVSTFEVLDLETLARRPLGTLPIAPFACQAGDGYLVCPGADDLLHIWRYGG